MYFIFTSRNSQVAIFLHLFHILPLREWQSKTKRVKCLTGLDSGLWLQKVLNLTHASEVEKLYGLTFGFSKVPKTNPTSLQDLLPLIVVKQLFMLAVF